MSKDADGQAVAFPDLDMTTPAHKALLNAAKSYARSKASRDAEKEKMDGKMEHLVALMHKNKISKFRHDGVVAEIIGGREKVTVKIDEDVQEDAGADL